MLGGLWGGVGGILKDIEALVDAWGRYSVQGDCDRFVSEVVYPIIADDYICHDSWGHFADARPFPSHAPLEGTEYVGARVLLENGKLDVWRRLGEYDNEVVQLRAEIDVLHSQISEFHRRQRESPEVDAALEFRALKEARLRGSKTILARLLRSGMMKVAGPAVVVLLDRNRRLREKISILEQRLQKLEQSTHNARLHQD